MTKSFKTSSLFFLFILFIFQIALIQPGKADDLAQQIDALAAGGFSDRAKVISALAETADTRVIPALNALGEGNLFLHKASNKVVMVETVGDNYAIIDPLTLKKIGEEPKAAFEKIKVNNSLRRAIRDSLGGLQLRSKNPSDRRAAAEDVFKAKDPDAIPLLDAAIAIEADQGAKES